MTSYDLPLFKHIATFAGEARRPKGSSVPLLHMAKETDVKTGAYATGSITNRSIEAHSPIHQLLMDASSLAGGDITTKKKQLR